MYPTSALKYFSTIGKNYYWQGTKHRRYGFEEWRFFWWMLTSMHIHLRILRIYFLHIMYLLLFFKQWDFQRKDTYFKLTKQQAKFWATCATFLSRIFLFQWAQSFFNSKHWKQWKFWVVNKWEIREKCKI